MRDDDPIYDFDQDAWVARPSVVHARWSERALPEPDTPPAPGRWLRPPARPSIQWRSLIRPLVALGVVVGLLLVAALGVVLGVLAATAVLSGFVGFAVALVVWTLGGLGLCRTLPNRETMDGLTARPEDLRLLESPEDLDVCLVEVVILDQDSIVGADRGVAWFEGGRLLFSGHRTSFAIGGEDVLPVGEWVTRFGEHPLAGLPLEALPLRHAWRAASVRFVALHHAPDGIERAARFQSRFNHFRRHPCPSRGPRQSPPFGA